MVKTVESLWDPSPTEVFFLQVRTECRRGYEKWLTYMCGRVQDDIL